MFVVSVSKRGLVRNVSYQNGLMFTETNMRGKLKLSYKCFRTWLCFETGNRHAASSTLAVKINLSLRLTLENTRLNSRKQKQKLLPRDHVREKIFRMVFDNIPCIPTLIHAWGWSSPSAHSLKMGMSWSLCLFETWCMKEFTLRGSCLQIPVS